VKRRYVWLVRLVRSALRALGVIAVLDRAAERSRTALWVRSWFAIYDLDDLLVLDTPWWTFEAADRVEAFLASRPDARVFEWGSGASTVWLAARSGSVSSVEHDSDWAARIIEVLPANAVLTVCPPASAAASTAPGAPAGRGTGPGVVLSRKSGFAGLDFRAYVDQIDTLVGDLDLIVIDGRAREACLDKALTRLAPGGLVVLDNVDRARYRDALALHADVDVVWTRGRTPALPYPTRTALISRGPR